MFEQLFERAHAVARHRRAPLVKERTQFLHHLAEQGMARSTLRVVACYLIVVAEHLRLDRRCGLIDSAEIESKARFWAARKTGKQSGENLSPSGRRRFRFHGTQWLRFLGRMASERPARPSPCRNMVAAYAAYMTDERGLSEHTIAYRCRAITEFLDQLEVTERDLRKISLATIDEVLVRRVTDGAYARVTVQTYASSLRSFFRLAESRGWCRNGVASGIKAPRVFPHEGLPIGPSWKDVKRLVATAEGEGPTDIRDRAILLLLSVYGLRNREVIFLRLEDFDWKRELLLVRRYKTREAHRFPLTHPVGEAVLQYLRKVRPRSAHREVFLTMRAPFRPLHAGLWRIVARRLQALGVSLPHYGPHALRHACATRLLAQGLSLKEIGDHLGHRRPDTTRIYAKVDLDGLRRVAEFDLGVLQ